MMSGWGLGGFPPRWVMMSAWVWDLDKYDQYECHCTSYCPALRFRGEVGEATDGGVTDNESWRPPESDTIIEKGS